jgi:tRNA threonylcarbamoyladenosine biosynthesis protein TsaB
MRLLIDASSTYRLVCLYDAETLLDSIIEQGNHDHSKHLLPQIDRLLQRHSLRPCELDAIIVGEGPGSYTGVRIAVTLAKSFAIECQIPLFKVDSLSLFASAFQGVIAVVIPMKRSTVIGGLYDVQSITEPIHPAGYYSLEAWHQLCGMNRTTEPFDVTIDIKKLQLDVVDDVMTFRPHYGREWQPT